MQLGMIGLGRMGANMVRRLMNGGHQCVVYDPNVEAVQTLAREGDPAHCRWTISFENLHRRERFG